MPKLGMGTGSRVLMCHGGPPLCRGPHDSANDSLELKLRPVQLTGMHHEKAHLLLRHPPIAVLNLRRPEDALPMPTAARFGLGTPSLFCQEGQDGLLLSP